MENIEFSTECPRGFNKDFNLINDNVKNLLKGKTISFSGDKSFYDDEKTLFITSDSNGLDLKISGLNIESEKSLFNIKLNKNNEAYKLFLIIYNSLLVTNISDQNDDYDKTSLNNSKKIMEVDVYINRVVNSAYLDMGINFTGEDGSTLFIPVRPMSGGGRYPELHDKLLIFFGDKEKYTYKFCID